MSLRTRVLASTVLVAVVLAAAAVLVTQTIEAHLVHQLDVQLETSSRRVGPVVGRPPTSTVPRGFPDPPTPLFVGVVSADGRVETVISPNAGEESPPLPKIDGAAAMARAGSGAPFTVGSIGSDLRYRALAQLDARTGQAVVVALPLADVDRAVDRLVTVEVLATVAVLGVLAIVTWWVVRLGVAPVKRMTAVATAIAGGDLSHRVPEGAPGTEAAELGSALNRMLGRVEEAFDERGRADERLRRFVADASHELRTPVTTIRGYAELHRAGGLDDRDELDEAFRRTEQEAIRMGKLIEDMLLLARFDQRRPVGWQPVDLAEVVDDVARDARAVDPGREITVDGDRPLLVLGDADLAHQIVANVVNNAVVHTPPATAVHIRVHAVDGRAVVAITDHGEGMSAEAVSRAFERFYRSDPSRSRHRGGSGLGLAIVDGAVEALGGTVALESTPGQGTVVRVTLPLPNLPKPSDFRPPGGAGNSQETDGPVSITSQPRAR